MNRGTSFTILPADEKIDPALLPRINLSDLDQHGLTEIVSTVYQCKSLVAEDAGPEVKKQMGPFGEVIILHNANQLLLQDTVGNLKRITKHLNDQEKNDEQAQTYSHRCIYIRAADAESTLRSFLGDQKITEMRIARPSPAPPAWTRRRRRRRKRRPEWTGQARMRIPSAAGSAAAKAEQAAARA